MRPEQYQNIYHWFIQRPRAYRLLEIATKGLPLFTAACYGVLLVWLALFAHGTPRVLLKAIGVPAVTLVVGSLIRCWVNAPRPYERGIKPLLHKETKGQSWPSRHALSAGVIAAVWLVLYPTMGTGVLLLAVGVCVTRVLAGVHSVWDVTAGLFFGLICGLTGMLA